MCKSFSSSFPSPVVFLLPPFPAASDLRLAHLASPSRRVNIETGVPEDRPMTTGLHTVRDVMCAKCGEVLGWKYGELSFLPFLPFSSRLISSFRGCLDKAYEPSQKYKEGKFILEKAMTSELRRVCDSSVSVQT